MFYAAKFNGGVDIPNHILVIFIISSIIVLGIIAKHGGFGGDK